MSFFVSLCQNKILMQKINCSTVYRKELRDRILVASMREFWKRGVRAVKMDDIAGKLGISKRTLYEIYTNKEQLLYEGVALHEEEMSRHLEAFSADASHTVIDVVLEFYMMKIKRTKGMNPLFFEELHKYPHVLEFFEQKHLKMRERQNSFLRRGVQEGYFRADVDYDIISRLADNSLEYVMRSQMYREYKIDYLLHNVTLLYLRGICTEKGVAALDERMAQEDAGQDGAAAQE